MSLLDLSCAHVSLGLAVFSVETGRELERALTKVKSSRVDAGMDNGDGGL